MKPSDDLRLEDLFEQEKKVFIFVHKNNESTVSNYTIESGKFFFSDNILDTENIRFIFK